MPILRAPWRAYRREIGEARARVSRGSDRIETARGPIEYAARGTGSSVVLVSHGAGGGFDQGLDASTALLDAGMRVIAPSRFGYLRTPMPADASPATQADAYAALLDALEIERVAVLGISAGGPSALQFAIRHPSRTAALVLMVPLAYPAHTEQRSHGAMPERMPLATKWFFDAALSSDFLFWSALRFAPRMIARTVLGTRPEVLESASAVERARAQTVAEHVLPIAPRRLGLMNDATMVPLPRYELERIEAPTLVIAAEDCLYGTYDGARFSAEHIRGARLSSFPTGGHLWVGHHDEVTAEIAKFLARAAQPAADQHP